MNKIVITWTIQETYTATLNETDLTALDDLAEHVDDTGQLDLDALTGDAGTSELDHLLADLETSENSTGVQARDINTITRTTTPPG